MATAQARFQTTFLRYKWAAVGRVFSTMEVRVKGAMSRNCACSATTSDFLSFLEGLSL